MLKQDIITRHCKLAPMKVNVDALGAWRATQGDKPLGFVLAYKAENAVDLNFCLNAQSEPFQQEIVRAMTDALLLAFPCDYVKTCTLLQDVLLKAALEAEGFVAGTAFTMPDAMGNPVALASMTLSRFEWFGLETSRPFDDVNVIEGDKIDLHCCYTLEASVQKGLVPAYCFEIAPHGEYQTVGRIDLRLGYTEKTYYGGNIGYGLQEAFRGRGYAAEACRMLVPLIRRHGMQRVVITCRPDNLPSRGTCENIGAKLVRQLELPKHTELYEKGDREICIYHWIV